jgi:hypothetical protein
VCGSLPFRMFRVAGQDADDMLDSNSLWDSGRELLYALLQP